MISFLGLCIENLIKTLKYLKDGNLKFVELVRQAAAISYDSLPIALVTVFIAAVVISLQVSKQFLMSGGEDYIGGFISLALVREIAPGFAALAICARAGTALCAQVANMQVTSQIDAIKTMKIDPVGYYFAPRILAGAVTVPMVVLWSELLGILGGMFVSLKTIGLHPSRYMNTVWQFIHPRDIYISLFKGCVFGILLTLVCATQGYSTTGGAKDVGISTTKSAIKSTIYLLIADFLINLVFYLK